MTEAYRRRILADMGIPSWRLRALPGAQVQTPAPTSPAARPAGMIADRHRARAADDVAARSAKEAAVRSANELARDDLATRADEGFADAGRQGAAGARAAVPGAAAGHADTPWAVLSLAQGGVVLLADGECSRRDLRFARDILAAVTGDWRGKPVRRLFQWPPELSGQGIDATADAGRRALKAFLDKDLADHCARLLLCAEPVVQRLDSAGGGCPLVTLPSLHALGADPDAKQALWRTLAPLWRTLAEARR